MRLNSLLLATLLVTLATPALAGSVTYADSRGRWQSTSCTPPQPYLAGTKNAETPANDLNAQVAERNRYAAEAHAYMECISKEAQRDSDALGLLVTQSAKAIIDKTQAEANAALSGPQPQASVTHAN